MQRALQERERGTLALTEGAAAAAHRPHRFHAAALGDAGLARRLTQTAALAGHSGGVAALAWTEGGELLASGGEDCRLRLWRSATGELLHAVDTVRLLGALPGAYPRCCCRPRLTLAPAHQHQPCWVPAHHAAARCRPPCTPPQGHTAPVLAACFLPASRGDQLLCCSADRQIRHLNVTKGAVRPYLVHSGAVRAVVPLDPRGCCSNAAGVLAVAHGCCHVQVIGGMRLLPLATAAACDCCRLHPLRRRATAARLSAPASHACPCSPSRRSWHPPCSCAQTRSCPPARTARCGSLMCGSAPPPCTATRSPATTQTCWVCARLGL